MRREAQARKVAYYFHEVKRTPDEVEGKYTKWWVHEVHNLSDEPIYRVQHHQISPFGTRIPMYLRFRDVLLPGQSFTFREGRYPSKSRRAVQFLDNSGRPWIRSLKGDLKEVRAIEEWWRESVGFRLKHRAYKRTVAKFLDEYSQN